MDVERLTAWETGTARPTIRQARTFAQRLHVPFGYLFLSSPPAETLALPDLRTVRDRPPGQASPEFHDLLNDVLRKQEWYREYREDNGADPIRFVGAFDPRDDPKEIAADMASALAINAATRASARSWEEFLRGVIRRCEAQGILVFRSGVVGNNTQRPLQVDEFRGFAISDELAPLIFINAKDTKAAQIFTVAHELAHIWTGVSAISNPDYRARSSDQDSEIERACNRIAAELLVPTEDFVDRWSYGTPVEDNLQALARRYRVSAFVVLRQAYDLEIISRDTYWEHYDELIARVRPGDAGEDSGGNFYTTFLARNSATFTAEVIAAVTNERIPYRDAAQLLNVRAETLEGVTRFLSNPASSG